MTEIAIRQPAAALDVALPAAGPLDDWLHVLTEVVRLAEVVCQTPFVPDAMRGNAPAVAAAILASRELGIPPMTGLANIHVIKGKTGLSALMMRALIQAQGHEWQEVEVSDTRVAVRGRRKGEQDWTEAEFTIEQAKVAKIESNGYPQDKLYARASSRLARRKFADVIAGMPYSAEELADGDFADVAPRQPVTAADLKPAGGAAQEGTPPAPAVPGTSPTVSPAGPGAATVTDLNGGGADRPTAAASAAAPAAGPAAAAPAQTAPSGAPDPAAAASPAEPDSSPRGRRHKSALGNLRNALGKLPFEAERDDLALLSRLTARDITMIEGLRQDEAVRVLQVVDAALLAHPQDPEAALGELWGQARTEGPADA